jgi:hypothetical protein
MIGPRTQAASITGRRERYRIALIAHRLDDDDAKSGKIGERSARNAGEYHLRRDRDLREAAAHPAEHVAREIEDAFRDAADVQKICPASTKKGTASRAKAVDALDHHARHDVERSVRSPRPGERRDADRDADGHAERHQQQHRTIIASVPMVR